MRWPARFARTGVWGHGDFVLLWFGQLVSGLGSQVTLLALPLTAIIVLDATPTQVGILTALGFAPALVFGLFAGVWTDRLRRRSILIACDVLRGLMVLSVPVATWLHVLRIEQLYVAEFVAGTLVNFAYVASSAYVPRLVGHTHAGDANAALATSASAVRVAGPGLAGVAVQLLTAPIALVLDAASFAFSAACLQRIRTREPVPVAAAQRGVLREIHEGLYLLLRSQLLLAPAISSCIYNFFAALFTTVSMLFLLRELELSPSAIGVIVASSGVGAVVGGLAARLAARLLGIGPAMISAALALAVSHAVAPLAFGPPFVVVPLLMAAHALSGIGQLVLTVNRQTLVQHEAPDYALGRVLAAQSVIQMAAVPFGSLLGGALGELIGLRGTLAVGAVGTVFGMLTLLASPLRGLRELQMPPPPLDPTRLDAKDLSSVDVDKRRKRRATGLPLALLTCLLALMLI